MILDMLPKSDVFEGTVQWRQHYRTIPCTPFDKKLLTLHGWEIYFPKYHRDILIKGDLSIGEHCFSESIIIVEGNVRCYQKSCISQLSTKKSFVAPQGNVTFMFLESYEDMYLGPRCNVGIAKSDSNVTVGRNSIVQTIIGKNITLHCDCSVGRVYAREIVRIPKGFPEETIIECKKIEYL